MFHQKFSGNLDENMMGGTCRRRAGVVKCLKVMRKNLKV